LLANNNLEQLNWSRLPLGSVDPQQLGACALNFRGDPPSPPLRQYPSSEVQVPSIFRPAKCSKPTGKQDSRLQ